MYRLLLVDDETATREGILEAISWQELGIAEVRTAKNGFQALEIAAGFVPDILLTDIKMPRMNGIDLAHKIRELNPDCSILIMSGYSEVDYLKSAIRLSALNFVDKPVEIDKLTQWICKCVEVQEGIRRNKAYAENRRLFLLGETALGLIRKETD
jgi:two-component system response regulator YesN